jgi:hypothetical protein
MRLVKESRTRPGYAKLADSEMKAVGCLLDDNGWHVGVTVGGEDSYKLIGSVEEMERAANSILAAVQWARNHPER